MQDKAPNLPTPTTYAKVLKLIRKEIRQGLFQITQFAEKQNVVTSWRTGRHLDNYTSDSVRGDGVLVRFAGDLDVSVRFLQDLIRFYRLYPELPTAKDVSWSHYRALLSVSDPARRKQLEKRISKEKLKVLDLRAILRELKTPKISTGTQNLVSLKYERGQLYTYRIIKANSMQGVKSRYVIDCGFAMHVEKPDSAAGKYLTYNLVETIKTDKGYQLKTAKVKRSCLYTYVAFVERVVDGDTLIAHIDCGFGIWIRERLRLRGIDTPEMSSIAGVAADKYVEKALKKCDFVIIRTTQGADKYDRYLADIFYLPGETDPATVTRKGLFLNQQLLDAGLAVRW